MSRPTMTIITYDVNGKVSAIDHRAVRVGVADFGDGPKKTEEEVGNRMASNLISGLTMAAVKKFIDAFEIDVVAERKRVAAVRREEAEQATKAATEATARAEEKL